MSFALATGKKDKKPFKARSKIFFMSIAKIKEAIPDYAKDLRINLDNVLSEEGALGLSKKQILGTALSLCLSFQNAFLTKNILEESRGLLDEKDLFGIQAAVSLMGMNNIYYRSLHLAEDEELSQLPARLRMSMMNNHGIPTKDFEIYSLAVSCLSGCGMCIKSHVSKLRQEGLSSSALQSVIRISALMQGLNQSLNMSQISSHS